MSESVLWLSTCLPKEEQISMEWQKGHKQELTPTFQMSNCLNSFMFYLGVTASIWKRTSIISRREGSSPGLRQFLIYFKDVPLAVVDTNISSFSRGSCCRCLSLSFSQNYPAACEGCLPRVSESVCTLCSTSNPRHFLLSPCPLSLMFSLKASAEDF